VPNEWRENVQLAITKMQYWAAEGPGVSRMIKVIKGYLNDMGFTNIQGDCVSVGYKVN
jgi:hypothetical protein